MYIHIRIRNIPHRIHIHMYMYVFVYDVDCQVIFFLYRMRIENERMNGRMCKYIIIKRR